MTPADSVGLSNNSSGDLGPPQVETIGLGWGIEGGFKSKSTSGVFLPPPGDGDDEITPIESHEVSCHSLLSSDSKANGSDGIFEFEVLAGYGQQLPNEIPQNFSKGGPQVVHRNPGASLEPSPMKSCKFDLSESFKLPFQACAFEGETSKINQNNTIEMDLLINDEDSALNM